MRRVVLSLATAVVAMTTAACGGADVTVLTHLEGTVTEAEDGPAVVPLTAIPVRLLPYDRDALFDSLSAAHPVPEPQIPDTIFELQQVVSERYREWQSALSRWGALRDSLQVISRRMERMDRGSGEYLVLFRDFNDLAAQVDRLDRESNQAFRDFEQLQGRLTTEAREIQLQRELWSDEAFAPVDSIIQDRLAQQRTQEHADTTNSQGIARFRNIRPGRWWVYARFDRGFDELYWNLPVELERGEELELRLNPQNAEVRPKL
jgi:hypothetical protein